MLSTKKEFLSYYTLYFILSYSHFLFPGSDSRIRLNNGMGILSLPKDPIIAPMVQAVTKFPFSPFSPPANYYKPQQLQNFLRPERAEASSNNWSKNDYPFGATFTPLPSMHSNEQRFSQNSDNFRKMPYNNFHPLVYSFLPAF